MRRSHWARHWACAIDVLELLSTEAALLPSGYCGVANGFAEEAFDSFKGVLLQLISEQYKPGGQHIPVFIYSSHNNR